jgi:hypothetical protein
MQSIATFQILSSYVPRGCNSVYKVEIGRVASVVHVAGECYAEPSIGHLMPVPDPY